MYTGPLTKRPSWLLGNKSTLVLDQRLDCLLSLHSQGLGWMQATARQLILQGYGCAAELRVCSRFVWLWDACSESCAPVVYGSKESPASGMLLMIMASLLSVAL